MNLEIISYILIYLTGLADIAIIVLILLWFSPLAIKKRLIAKEELFEFVGRNFLWLAFTLSLTAVLGSLFYSELLNYPPCELCWMQRLFIYPQAVLFGVALLRKDKKIIPYTLVLSIIGLPIAIYHYFLQLLDSPGFCDVTVYSAKCSDNLLSNSSYITIPMMSITVFSLLIIFQLIHLKESRKKQPETNFLGMEQDIPDIILGNNKL
jgi:disulfide bond formation protein DsbB